MDRQKSSEMRFSSNFAFHIFCLQLTKEMEMTSFAMSRSNDPRTHVQRQDSDTATIKKDDIIQYEKEDNLRQNT